jgi:serine/threonine protein kinase
VKVLPGSFADDPDRLRRFEQEARAASALNHPGILTMHDFGEHDGSPHVVSELLEGQNLRERMAGSALPVRKALDYAVQIALGLAAAHEKGIDLDPPVLRHEDVLGLHISQRIEPKEHELGCSRRGGIGSGIAPENAKLPA